VSDLFVYNTGDSKEHEWWSQVKNIISGDDITNFKNWQGVRAVPLYRDDEPFANSYLSENKIMLNQVDWGAEWIKVLNEPKLGHNDVSYQKAQISIKGLATTNWVMKCLHHILTFETMHGKSIIEYDNIVELGAGIGEVARLILDRGFLGKYYIIDFPEIGKLSSYYLNNKNIQIDNVDQLCEIDNSKTLFIATWSLSEVPFEYRNHIGRKLRGCDCLITYQKQFKEIDNTDYFINEWCFASNCFYRLRDLWFHRGDGGNTYFIGKGI
jgi:hypothetical protein